MKKIHISNCSVDALVDDEDFVYFSQWSWNCDKKGYVRRRVGEKMFYLHQEILCPKIGFEIDHINRNPLDNRKSNLRYATRSQNMANRPPHKNNKSGFRGVMWHANRWQVYIKKDGKEYYLGRFKDIKIAARVYDEAAKKFWGEFAFQNIVP